MYRFRWTGILANGNGMLLDEEVVWKYAFFNSGYSGLDKSLSYAPV